MQPIRSFTLSGLIVLFSTSLSFSQAANNVVAQQIEEKILNQPESVGNDLVEESAIGTSYDSLLKDFTNNKCVKRISGPQHLGSPTSPHSSTGVTLITHESQYAESTSVSVSAAYNSGTASGNASASYIASGKINSYDSTALLVSDVQYAPQQFAVSDFALTDDAKGYLRTGYAIFRQYCGDRFVTGYRRGGQFIATLTIHNSSDASQVDTKVTLDASYSGGSASAAFSQLIDKSSKDSNLDYRVSRDGLTDEVPNLSANDLITYAQSYPTKVTSLPTKPINQYLTSDYGPLIFKAAQNMKVSVPQWMHLLNDQYIYLFSLYRYRADLNYIVRHPEEFISIDQIPVSKQETSINREIDSLLSWGTTCLVTKGRDCPDNRASNLAAIPSYSAPRARPWVKFDAKSVTPQYIGSADRDMILELVGKWQTNPMTPPFDITFSSKVLLNKGAASPIQYITSPRIPVAQGFAAYFEIIDAGPSDNSSDRDNPIRGRLGVPLDDFVAGK